MCSEHKEILKRESHLDLEDRHRKSFPKWFKARVNALHKEGSSEVNDELYALSFGPDNTVSTFTSCNVSGIRWHVKQLEETKAVQNSGIMVPGLHGDRASDFYGSLVSVVKLNFICGYSVILFKGQWYNTSPSKKRKRQGIIRDYHLMSLNTNIQWYSEDPYVLAAQAKQIFYLDDPQLGGGWKVIQKIQHRHVWDVPENEEAYDAETNYDGSIDQEDEAGTTMNVRDDTVYSGIHLHRDDVEPETVILSNQDIGQRMFTTDDDFIDDDYIEELQSEDEENSVQSDDDSDLD